MPMSMTSGSFLRKRVNVLCALDGGSEIIVSGLFKDDTFSWWAPGGALLTPESYHKSAYFSRDF